MTSRKSLLLLLALVIGAGATYGLWRGYHARRDLVTLNVRNMEVREVVRKLERQTWEKIYVHKAVQGKVTLHVRKLPLESVLRIVGDQTSSRWSALYPIYSRGQSWTSLEKALRGEVDPGAHGWSGLQNRSLPGGPMFGFGGPRADTNAPSDARVSLQFQQKDMQFAVTAVSRFAQARVVAEDGIARMINLTLEHATVTEAVDQLADRAGRKWSKVYTLRGEGRPGEGGGAPQFTRNQTERPGEGRSPGFGEMTPAEREEMRQARQALEEELRQALPPVERDKMELAQQAREQQWQEFQNLTPEQRRERFAQLGSAGREQRTLERIKNTTPEQRVDRYRRMAEMRQRWQERSAR